MRQAPPCRSVIFWGSTYVHVAARHSPQAALSCPASRRDAFSDRRPTFLYVMDSEQKSDARIAVSPETRNLVRSKKRGGETYDELLQKMLEQYELSEESLDS